MRIEKDLVAASAAPLVLGILAEGETYGYEMIKRVEELSGGEVAWTDAMLYPLLHRLERLGHVQAQWRTSDSGRKRKYYAITDSGRQMLAERREQWQVVSAALDRIWQQASAGAAATRPAPTQLATAW